MSGVGLFIQLKAACGSQLLYSAPASRLSDPEDCRLKWPSSKPLLIWRAKPGKAVIGNISPRRHDPLARPLLCLSLPPSLSLTLSLFLSLTLSLSLSLSFLPLSLSHSHTHKHSLILLSFASIQLSFIYMCFCSLIFSFR